MNALSIPVMVNATTTSSGTAGGAASVHSANAIAGHEGGAGAQDERSAQQPQAGFGSGGDGEQLCRLEDQLRRKAGGYDKGREDQPVGPQRRPAREPAPRRDPRRT